MTNNNNDWTPVTEGLPTPRAMCIVTVEDEYGRRSTILTGYKEESGWGVDRVVAWIKIPPPWMG